MAFIEPNSTIWILTGVPLDKSYSHTYYPWATGDTATRSTQFNSFVSHYLRSNVTYKGKTYSYTLNRYSFLRHNRNSIRVKMPIELLYDCNYMIFENTGYNYSDSQRKKFYAFIDDVKYINDNTTEIMYTIDVMQTWHFDYSLDPCFVEREHIASDNRGDNIIAEPIDCGAYNTYSRYGLLRMFEEQKWYIVFVCTFSTSVSLSPASGSFSGGTWNQCEYKEYYCYNPLNLADPDVMSPMDIQTDVNSWLNFVSVLNRTNSIITMYMCPEFMLPSKTYGAAYANKDAMISSVQECSGTFSSLISNVDITARPRYPNWTPHNQKMLTYPYCFFTVDNNQGVVNEYRYENFYNCRTGTITSGDILFNVYWNNAVKPRLRIVPVDYDNSDSLIGNSMNTYEKCIDIDDFAIGTWATNDFMAKVVQGGIGLAITAATIGGSNVAPGVTGVGKALMNNAAESMAYGRVQNIARGQLINDYDSLDTDQIESRLNAINHMANYDEVPWADLGKDFVKATGALALFALRSNIKSSLGNGNINLTSGCFDFILSERHVDVRYAKIIDQYFDMYGYQTNELKVPNRNSRPYFNYVKTSNCKLHNEMMPQDAIKQIEDIYNNGITFWKDITTVGNYTYALNGLNVAGQG